MTWNVVHNFPGAKDTYQVPVDYPDVGYDTIIASWFTDIFTSILAMQDSLLDLVGKVLLLAGGTMTGNLVIDKTDPVIKFNAAEDGEASIEFYHGVVATFALLHDGGDCQFNVYTGDLIFTNAGRTIRFNCAALNVGTSDIEVLDKTKGLILRSPNDSRFRLEVSDGGVLSSEAL